MRAARCHQYGPPSVIVVDEVDDPVPEPGQVVVDIAAAAVNFPDVLLIADAYQVHVPVPFTPGSEFAGTVRAVAPDVIEWAIGDRVAGSALVGAFAQQIAVRASSLRMVDDAVDLEAAAASGVAHRTAYHALRSFGRVEHGEWVVVLGAAGGVGLAAIELGKGLGARMIAAASSSDKLDLCLSRGAEAVIDYRTESLKERIKEITGAGAHVVVDPVGGPHSEDALRALRWGGRFVTVGFASGEIPRIPLNLVMLKGVLVSGFTMGSFAQNQPEDEARDAAELEELARSGRMTPHISAAYPLDQTGLALAELADRHATGKILVTPNL